MTVISSHPGKEIESIVTGRKAPLIKPYLRRYNCDPPNDSYLITTFNLHMVQSKIIWKFTATLALQCPPPNIGWTVEYSPCIPPITYLAITMKSTPFYQPTVLSCVHHTSCMLLKMRWIQFNRECLLVLNVLNKYKWTWKWKGGVRNLIYFKYTSVSWIKNDFSYSHLIRDWNPTGCVKVRESPGRTKMVAFDDGDWSAFG